MWMSCFSLPTESDREDVMKQQLPRSFYTQDTLTAAREGLGKILVAKDRQGITAGRIVEVEMYFGGFDQGSHSFKDRLTVRTRTLFKRGGVAYIFHSHMYWQLCFVTAQKGRGDAVLIRGLEPIEGIPIMQKRRGKESLSDLCSGPGKLCEAMDITKRLNDTSMTSKNASLWITDDGTSYTDTEILCSPRIGIPYAGDFEHKHWRLFVKDSTCVSHNSKNKDGVPYSELAKKLREEIHQLSCPPSCV